MLKFRLIVLLLCSYSFIQAQDFSNQSPSVEYRGKENPHYWKNRKPHEAYWQQDVHYTIDATIDDETDILHGNNYKLVYYNNSPFDLNELYFFLHNNAFQPGSYYHALSIANNVKVEFGDYEKKGLGTEVENLKVNDAPVLTEIDNTVMKVFLNQPLRAGDSLVVTMNFKTYYDTGTMRRRMKMFDSFGFKHYDGVQWYPAIMVYDPKSGWNTDQHLDKEFYGNFGTFDISLTFPHNYIVDATGVLQNKAEVLPDSLREKLDLKNFASKPFNEAPSIIIPREEGKTKTWIYHAKNVHNFAFTADPMYRIGELEWNGIKIVTLAQEPHASGWQKSGLFTMNVIKIYSEDFGMYDWPKIIVADARDGMEYPMLTLDGGTYPQHQGLLAHEVGHMWFYGMVGTNETYRAFMDEGFTQFLTVWSMDKIVGETRARIGRTKYVTNHVDSSNTRYENLYYPYLNHVVEGYDEQLNTHSSGFHGALRHGGNYGLVYYKSGTMLYNLKYVLGDELFLNAMQHYVNKWKFAHPYPEDFRQAIIEYTQTDLNWFFDQWLETTKFIDYSVDKIKNKKGNEYEIQFSRKGSMQMPIDFTVVTEEGIKYKFHIPNTWFIKNTDATVLPKWYGWDLLNPTYTAKVNIPEKIDYIEIDPIHYLADVDLRDNKKGAGGISTYEFDHRIRNLTRWDKQKNFYRPDIWYNSFDGIQVGAHLKGSYFGKHSYSITAWYNTEIGENLPQRFKPLSRQLFAFNIENKNTLNQIWRGTSTSQGLYYNAGIARFTAGLEKVFREPDLRVAAHKKIFLNTKYLINADNYQGYLLYPEQWGRSEMFKGGQINASINLGYFQHYTYNKGNGEYTFSVRVPSIGSDFNYSYLNLNSINRINLSKFEIKTRLFAQLGIGDFPLESSLYLAGMSPEYLIENKFTRARGIVPNDWLGYGATPNNFHMGGGLNLRGYSGYLAPDRINIDGQDTLIMVYQGNSGASFNVEIDFDKFIKIPAKGLTKNFHLDTYLFSGIGILNYKNGNNTHFGKLRMDAGLGTALTIKFSPLDVTPLVLRFDMPFFLNTPPADSDYLEFRWVLGLNRAF